MAKTINVTWVSEEDAAKEMGMAPLYFRRLVKKGHLQDDINYVQLHRRCIQYNMEDIKQYKIKTSSLKQTA